MNDQKYLLDTNIIIALFVEEPNIIKKLGGSAKAFVPSIAIGELFYGAGGSAKKEANISRIEAFCKISVILNCDIETARQYGILNNQLRKAGKHIPDNDIWIAAIAKQHGLTVVTRDKHFSYIQGIPIEKW